MKGTGAISRAYTTDLTVRIGATAAAADEIDLRELAGGSIQLDDGSPVTLVTIWASHQSGGTYVPAYDDDDTLLTLVTSHSTIRRIPEAVFGFPFIKLVGNAADDVTLFLKG
jgi:hypothetical protein